jgi:hypothetical protein
MVGPALEVVVACRRVHIYALEFGGVNVVRQEVCKRVYILHCQKGLLNINKKSLIHCRSLYICNARGS